MQGLGPLEASVMRQLWATGEPRSVRAVMEQLARDREIAYTTVMTVMDNLHRKGLLARTRQGRAYVYSPIQSLEEYTATLLGEILAGGGDRRGVLMHFVEGLDADEFASLREVLSEPDRPGEHRG